MSAHAHILLTGASGFIGFSALLAFLEAGHKVRFTARSQEKAGIVASHPAIQRVGPGDRLESFIVEDITVEGSFDAAMKDITHVVHIGSPLGLPHLDPIRDIFVPTIQLSENLLRAAQKTPSVARVVITSSVVGTFRYKFDPDQTYTPDSRPETLLPYDTVPRADSFIDNFDAYCQAKAHELHYVAAFVEREKPSFTVSTIHPGWVFGRNPLVLDAESMVSNNSSNTALFAWITGRQFPLPVHTIYTHIQDLTDLYLKATLSSSAATARGKPATGAAMVSSYGLAREVDYDTAFSTVAKMFPKATAKGIFAQSPAVQIPVKYDTSKTERELGIEMKTFERAVIDAAEQYLEILGEEKA